MSENRSPADSSENKQLALQAYSNNTALDLRLSSSKRHLHVTGDGSLLGFSCSDPRQWRRTDVENWLQWAVGFYQHDNVDKVKFAMNGRGLCLLTRAGFMSRAPSCGDVLHSDFQKRYAMAVLKSDKAKRRSNIMKTHERILKKKAERSEVEDRKDEETLDQGK